MIHDYDGRVAIVTGATRGLGRAVTRRLLDAGASVIATGRTADSCATLATELADDAGRVEVVQVDLRDPDAGERLVTAATAHWGRLDLVVNNAAPFMDRDRATGPTRADWLELIEAKLLGYWGLMTAAIPALTETHGAIVNVAGGAGLVASPRSPHNGAVNAAIIHLSDSYALALAPAGIRVNIVIPSVIDNDRFATRASRRAATTGISVDAARAELGGRVPAGFPTDPDEIADVILALGSPGGRSLTGAHVTVGGASHLRGHGGGA